MPRMDGIRATKCLKIADRRARVIIVTNLDEADLRQAALQAGAAAYVMKDNKLALPDLLMAHSHAT